MNTKNQVAKRKLDEMNDDFEKRLKIMEDIVLDMAMNVAEVVKETEVLTKFVNILSGRLWYHVD